MIGQILQAVIDECKKLLETSNPGATVIFKTDFKNMDLTTYSMPLLILDVGDAPDAGQQIGGLTRLDWQFALNTYNYMPNAQTSDDKAFSTGLMDVIDAVRRHFTKGIWLTQGMTDIEVMYGFVFSLSGIQGADMLDGDGLVLGYRIVFDSLAYDLETSDIIESTEVLEFVVDETREGVDLITGKPIETILTPDLEWV
jgi:hypothetical protein